MHLCVCVFALSPHVCICVCVRARVLVILARCKRQMEGARRSASFASCLHHSIFCIMSASFSLPAIFSVSAAFVCEPTVCCSTVEDGEPSGCVHAKAD